MEKLVMDKLVMDKLVIENINDKKICGLLVEPRRLNAIHELIKNYINVLGEMQLFFYCGKSCYKDMLDYYKDYTFIKINMLDKDNLTAKEYNDLLKNIKLWQTLGDYDYVLTIQTDGCLCKDSKFKLNDFLKYDYIGGYSAFKWWWKETRGLHEYSDYQCFNGGFSLRKVKSMIKVLEIFGSLPTEDYNDKLPFMAYGEDLYFVVGLLVLNKNGMGNYNVGLDDFAVNFCTHTHYVKNTFCVHKYDNYINKDLLKEFLNYCPEFINFTQDKLK